MRMGNPSVRRWTTKSRRGELDIEAEPSTYKGVYGKTALFALITIVVAIAAELIVFNMLKSDIVTALTWVGIATAVCTVPLIVISLVIAFIPSTVKVLGIIYSILQGGLLGCLALFVDMFFPGISIAALLGTGIVFMVSVVANKFLEVKISSKFVRGLLIAFFSIMIVELVMWALTAFGVVSYEQPVYWWIQLVISAVCIIWATIMLMWDLQNIDYLVQSGADKKYEWNFAFSLVTTLVYLYVEILELLMRLVMLFGNNKKK
ncbi:MAG: Bax inhibitor-1/YccA family protein [Clostridia bacterium]|nr:Bax inhibitor-1/YccA family protein [Clostridia bacterium]